MPAFYPFNMLVCHFAHCQKKQLDGFKWKATQPRSQRSPFPANTRPAR